MNRILTTGALMIATVSVAFGHATYKKAKHKPSCPAPTVARGRQCVLKGDTVLDRTLRLESSTKLNCQGHRLIAAAQGTPDDSRTTANEYVPSQPEVGIYVRGERDLKVQNCVMEGFDFGIVVADGKIVAPGPHLRNKFLSNTITARFPAVVIGADYNLFEGNRLFYGNGANGLGLNLLGDSDFNVIKNNIVEGQSIDPNTRVKRFPGGLLESFRAGDGILAHTATSRSVYSVVVGSDLVQVLSDQDTRNDDTVIKGNYVDSHTDTAYCIVSSDSRNVRVVGNEVRSCRQGIHFSGGSANFRLPGTCSADASRYCNSSAECFIPGVDTVSKGTCNLGPDVGFIAGGVDNGQIVRNKLIGPFSSPTLCPLESRCVAPDAIATSYNSRAPVISENEVTGAERAGIRIMGQGIESAVITRNVVYGNGYGLVFYQPTGEPFDAQFYGAKISLNDFTNSSIRAVSASAEYLLWSPLFDPDTLRGNYWGRTCDDSLGFREFDPDNPLFGDSSRSFIFDPYPFGVPVARTPDDSLPAPCTAP